jgi:hypothetical protein
MAVDRLSGFSSVFDDMQSRQRQAFERLSTPSSSTTPTAERPDAGPRSTDGALAASATAGLLDRRYRSWRYMVTDRHRDGDEVVVLCKLTVDDLQVQKMQFGRASIDGARAAQAVAGRSDGVAFRIAAARPERSAAAVAAAYERAIEDALARCARLL